MPSTSGLKNYLVVTALRGNVTSTARGMILFFRRSICLTSQNESSVTREKIDTLSKRLDKLGLGTNGGDELQSTRGNALLALVDLVALYLIPR